jgi:hypothetical protein
MINETNNNPTKSNDNNGTEDADVDAQCDENQDEFDINNFNDENSK